MPYLNLDLNYFEHPKTKRLIGLLGKGAAELPIRIWCYCGKYHAESGSLAGYSAQEIESIAGWWGKAGEMIEAMEKVQLLEKDGESWKVKDWAEINGHLIAFKLRAQTAALKRWDNIRNAPSNAQASTKQCPIPNLPTIPTLPTKPLTPIIPLPGDLEGDRKAIEDWLAYKREKGQTYKPKGLEALWEKFRKIPQHQRMQAVRQSMENNWSGLFEIKGGFTNGTRAPKSNFTPSTYGFVPTKKPLF